MTEREVLTEYVLELTHRRGVDERLLPTLLELLEVPKLKARWSSLSRDDIEDAVRGLVREEIPPARRGDA